MQTELSLGTDPTAELTEAYRLSPQQRLAWRLQEQQPQPNAQVILRAGVPIDEASVHTALATACERHELLRTTFHRVAGVALPFQTVNGRCEPEFRRRDLRSLR